MDFGVHFSKVSPLIKKRWQRWSFLSLPGKDVVPCFVWILHKTDEVYVVHERQAYHCHDLRKCAVAFYVARENCDEQVGNEHHPCLYLYGVDAVSIEEMEWEVLFQLFVKVMISFS